MNVQLIGGPLDGKICEVSDDFRLGCRHFAAAVHGPAYVYEMKKPGELVFVGRKMYLGDSVYAEWDGYYIVLTTENGYADDPRNRIVLEPEIYANLLAFVRKVEIQYEHPPRTNLP